jgi:hypothetical protein
MSSLFSDLGIDFVRCIAVQFLTRVQTILIAYKVLTTKINLNNKQKTLSFSIEIAEAEVKQQIAIVSTLSCEGLISFMEQQFL